jgi:hypothetical protein
MLKERQVEIRLAYAWDCEDCGRENFERAVVYELSPDERRELLEQGDSPETGNWLVPPERVKCHHCGSEFETKHFRSNDDAMIEQDGD